ncbi:MAG: DUF2797 domain-containing protein [Flavobacteriales bacterium]|jgi:hypothetical protein|nr:DUF2797 domain-containing protein [Flavobacteriales bacterium]
MDDGKPLLKMRSVLAPDGTVRYALPFDPPIDLSARVGQPLTLRATGALSCVSCGKRVKKLFQQGFCYPCLVSAPEAAECIVHPELCRAHLGEGRDPQWEHEHHNTEHVVYLSFTGNVKVGVTRATQVPTRWIDQGAVAALIIARVPYRQLAGLIEVDLKRIFADKTNWRAMLKEVEPDDDALRAARAQAIGALRADLQEHLLHASEPQAIRYPVLAYPPKVTSLSFEKQPVIGGTLMGIKGQYLLWEDGRVVNIRNQSGVHVVVEG